MADQFLQGRRILVAEDEYLIAFDVRDALTRAGAEVLGPVPSIEEVAELLQDQQHIDAAVLDVNLRGDMIFSVADTLRQRGVPLVFTTGYDSGVLPDRFANSVLVEKPLQGCDIAEVLEPLLSAPLT